MRFWILQRRRRIAYVPDVRPKRLHQPGRYFHVKVRLLLRHHILQRSIRIAAMPDVRHKHRFIKPSHVCRRRCLCVRS